MRWVATMALLALPLGGCLGGSDGEDADPLRKARVELAEGKGSIAGVVTDLAIRPIGGAVVRVAELDLTARAADDGSYAINEIPPGVYFVEATADAHVPATLQATVVEGEAASIDFVLTPILSDAAYTEVFELNGFIECSASWNVTVANGYHPLVDVIVNNGLAVCAVPNIVQENTTNDRFIHYFDFRPPVGGAVYQMEWDDSDAMAKTMFLISGLDGFSNDLGLETVRVEGPSPIQVVVPGARFEEIADTLTQRCEEDPGAGECGLNPFDQGWPMHSRVFAGWDCLNDTASACSTLQEDFTILVQAFYNQQIGPDFAPPPAA